MTPERHEFLQCQAKFLEEFNKTVTGFSAYDFPPKYL
jgi:hypothetical protein